MENSSKLLFLGKVLAGAVISAMVLDYSPQLEHGLGISGAKEQASLVNITLAQAEALAEGSDKLQAPIPTDKVISKLEEYEKQLLEGNQVAKLSPKGKAVATAPAVDDSTKELLSAKDAQILALQKQLNELTQSQAQKSTPEKSSRLVAQDKLVDQIILHRKEVKRLREILAKKDEKEKELNQELEEFKTQGRETESQYSTLQRQLKRLADVETERDALRAQMAGAQQAVDRMESELESKKSVESDNKFLKDEAKTLREELKRLQSVVTKGAESNSDLSKATARIKQLEAEISKTTASLTEVQKEKADLKKELDSRENILSEKEGDSSKLKEQLADLTKQNEALVAEKSVLEKSLQEQAGVKDSLDTESKSAKMKLQETEAELLEIRRQLSRTVDDTKTCQSDKAANDKMVAKMGDLERALIKAKNDLLLKDTEIKMLSGSSEVKVGNTASTVTEKAAESVASQVATQSATEPGIASRAMTVNPGVGSDVAVVEVKAKKVNLRSGAGNEHSPVMQVQAGMRLTVETREGDWYRVFTPTGSRAYIRADVVRPVTDAQEPAPRGKLKPGGQLTSEAADLVPLDDSANAGEQPEDEETKAFLNLQKGLSK